MSEVARYEDLRELVVLITGGGSGIGAALVRAFVRQGARVAFVDLDDTASRALCDEVQQAGFERPLYQPCDLRDIGALRACVELVDNTLGSVGVLINNAARDTRHQLAELTPEQWDEAMATNLKPHFFTAQAVAEGMRSRGRGSIINLGSNSALLGLAGYPAYVSAKAGCAGLTKALARELGPDGIRVNTLVPGWVMTKRQKALWATPEAVAECLAQQCLKTTVEEADIANAALFLASDASRMITGQSLVVDGGRA